MGRAKIISGWNFPEYVPLVEEIVEDKVVIKPFTFEECIIEEIKSLTASVHLNSDSLLNNLLRACNSYRWEREFYETRPKIASIKLAFETAVKYANEHAKILPELDEETADTIAIEVEEILYELGKAKLGYTPYRGTQDYLDIFIEDKSIRDKSLENFIARYKESELKKGGRPRSPELKQNFAKSVCKLLREAGLKVNKGHPHRYETVTKSRLDSALFYKILETLFHAMGEKPNDLRKIVIYAVDATAPKSAKSKLKRKITPSTV